LMEMSRQSRPSGNAIDIVEIVLRGGKADHMVKQGLIKSAIANNYMQWAAGVNSGIPKKLAAKKHLTARVAGKKGAAKKSAAKKGIAKKVVPKKAAKRAMRRA